ncbi:GNAT family N-acetyltransferase [Stenotrophomonas sp. TWI1183]|uniref:GNAT family N-acetyltransferase n=1 Tax=Stenotrophomonas sp. TWI1183 TaxID=3136799 RepID=UPI00320BA681
MPSYDIITLTTARLTLRPQVMSDFPAYAAFLASPRAVGVGGPMDERSAWGLFCHDLAQWPLLGHGALMIELTATGECIGQVGINHGPLFPESELGWLLYAGHEGQGYATEGAAALRDWAFSALALPTLVSYMTPTNAASAQVARRLGGVLDAMATRTDPKDLVYRYRPPAQR